MKNLFELYLNESEHFWLHCQYQLLLANCAEEENPAQPLRNGSYLPSFLATISNSLSEYFSSKTSCTSASNSGIEETENSENLLTVGGPLVSCSKLPVDMLNTPLRGMEAKPCFPWGGRRVPTVVFEDVLRELAPLSLKTCLKCSTREDVFVWRFLVQHLWDEYIKSLTRRWLALKSHRHYRHMLVFNTVKPVLSGHPRGML